MQEMPGRPGETTAGRRVIFAPESSYTIGGMMVFPGNRIDGRTTINGARGLHPRIKDRFDLTVECIRRHYSNEPSPLSETIARYSTFFELFRDFLMETKSHQFLRLLTHR